ncbi:hypothetical protein [Bradyrhizobium sp. Gha]|uniref:alpha/beta fold hydrolase n=1 Tax=Bradyrhizobium sp. Gha TaxID=1855318 RepID=UPI0008E252AA|nr:hypothetical protein [Bradyrhizobium sp. Gha]SFH85150.1 hypothetical protein SAMN05216525_102264 [Bradyrhizobium sp. Gha]
MDKMPANDRLGSFVVRDRLAGKRGHMNVHYYLPAKVAADGSPLIAIHGLDRAATDFRSVFVQAAEDIGKIILVPEFDVEAFPDVFWFNFGNVVSSPTLSPNNRDQWNYPLVDRVFEAAKASIGFQSSRFDLYGNSAGSQYALRCTALCSPERLRKVVISNSGIYMLPDLTVAYPYGMGNIGLGSDDLRRYLAQNVYVLLGEADVETDAADCPAIRKLWCRGHIG